VAQPIKLFENRALTMKVEDVYGVDEAPTAEDNAMLTMEGSVSINATKLTRKLDKPHLGADPFVLVGKEATAEFDFDLLGNTAVGTSAPCAPILKSCGYAEVLVATTSATYNPISSAYASATIYFYHSGLLFKITGARGSIDIDFSIKSWGKAHAKYTGIIQLAAPTEATPGELTYIGFRTPPAIEKETFLVNCMAVALNATAFKLSQGGDVAMYEGSEAREATYKARESTGSFTIFADALGVFNPWALANGHSQVPLFAEVGTVAGSITRVTCGQVQFEFSKITNLDGASGWEIPFTAPPTSAGNDEYSIRFT
jgi:hypothetical protein